MAPTNGLLPSFLAALQASLSVLLVIFYGALSAHMSLLDAASSKHISKVCVKIFLPALLLTQIGSELHPGSAHRYGTILLWAIVCHFVSFLIGIAAHLFLGMPDWITAAIMFNNTTSYPLLLIQSLDATGILNELIIGDESTRESISRAKSYFLVFATVSSCLTFAVGPRLIDSEHAPDSDDEDKAHEDDTDDDDDDAENGAGATSESNPLLSNSTAPPSGRRASIAPVSFFPSIRHPDQRRDATVYDRRPSVISRKRWHKLEETYKWWLLFLYDFLNAPLIGAALGAVIGLVPALHRAFFNRSDDGGIFTAWLTTSLQNIGGLFVPLPVVIAGVSLYLSYQSSKSRGAANGSAGGSGSSGGGAGTPWFTTAFVLVVRFVIWSVVSIASVYGMAKKTNWLGDDPMLWFAMMLMPTGPPAMKLITLVQVSDADEEDEEKVAKLLTISYIISPILAVTVVASLRASLAALHS